MADNGEMGDYSDPLAEAVASTIHRYIGLLRQNVGSSAATTLPRELADATPHSRRPEEFPGIRSYYAKAKSLTGLQVRTNWRVITERYDSADKSTSFTVAQVVNPHPGAHVLMFGAQGGYTQEAHIANPNAAAIAWPRKTGRREHGAKPVMLTNWQTLSGSGHWFHRGKFTHSGAGPYPGFADTVAGLVSRLASDGATEAFGKAAGSGLSVAQQVTWLPGLTVKAS